MLNDSIAYMGCLKEMDDEDLLVVFTQRLTTLFYPLTPVRDLHFTTQRLYEFHDSVLDLAAYRKETSKTVAPFVIATNRLVDPTSVDELTALVFKTLINIIAEALLERKP